MKSTNYLLLLTVVVSLVNIFLATPLAQADIVLFDDAYGSGWTKGTWDLYVDTEYAYGDNLASLRRSGSVVLKTTNPSGVEISQTPILQAYVNFVVTEATPGHALTNVKVRAMDGSLFEFDDRSVGWTCYLDGVEYVDAAEIVFDTNPQTWQMFEIDLSQVDYFGWPYQSRELGSQPVLSLEFSARGNAIGDVDMLVDEVCLVIPEPSTLIVLVCGIAELARQRRGRRVHR